MVGSVSVRGRDIAQPFMKYCRMGKISNDVVAPHILEILGLIEMSNDVVALENLEMLGTIEMSNDVDVR